MDVRAALRDRLLEDRVDQGDHLGVLGSGDDLVQVQARVRRVEVDLLDVVGRNVGLGHGPAAGYEPLDVHARLDPEVLQGHDVLRLGHRHREDPVLQEEGQRQMLAGVALVYDFFEPLALLDLENLVLARGVGDAELLGKGARDRLLARESQLHHRLSEEAVGLLGGLKGLVALLLGDHGARHQDVSQLHFLAHRPL